MSRRIELVALCECITEAERFLVKAKRLRHELRNAKDRGLYGEPNAENASVHRSSLDLGKALSAMRKGRDYGRGPGA